MAYTGEGADEILFGYDLFFENVLIEKINKIDFSNFAKLYRRINSYSKDAENSLFTKLAYANFKKRVDLNSFQDTKNSRNGLSNLLVNLFGLDKNLPKEVDARWEDYQNLRLGI